MKRITIITYGTRGDVTPLLYLAAALRERGYRPAVVIDREFENDIQPLGIEYFLYDLQLKTLFQSDQGKRAIESEFRVQSQREVIRQYHQRIRDMLDVCWRAAQGADLLMYQGDLFAPYHIAEALAVPCIMTSAVPNLSRTREFPLIGAPWIGDIKWLNRLSYSLYTISWFQAYPRIRAWCEETLKISAPSRMTNYFYRHGEPVPVLYSYSEVLLPAPSDWNRHTLASGFWHVDMQSEWSPSPDLEAFLNDGDAPVYIGFGSTVGPDPEKVARSAIDAVDKLHVRAVLNLGWGGLKLDAENERIFVIDHVPFDWLFSRVSAVVCHGGVGTIAYALQYGCPLVLCPYITDQHFWSARVVQLGAGVLAAPLGRLTPEALHGAIEKAIAAPAIRQRAIEAGETIRNENGMENAIRFIENYL